VSSASCEQHEGRAAVGICVHCRRPLCGDCITKVGGVNHCRACLEAQARAPAPSSPARRPLGVVPARLLLGAGVGALWLLSWIALSALLPGTP
jgi:hypothetical protein